MNTAVCTLFEGHYHYGLGALINSLYYHGFRGVIWVGYRGALPPWAKNLKRCQEYQEFTVAKECVIHFILLTTLAHFTNYKPDFFLQLWEHYCPDAEALFYFDPDIVIKCHWSFFEEWIMFGVALCEDTDSPVPGSHPLRMAWRRFYEPHGFSFISSVDTYVNGGFVGLTRTNKQFLHEWKRIRDLMAPAIGGLQNTRIKDRSFMFYNTEQDGMNIAWQCSKCPSSLMGKEAMDFIPGGITMSHAIGPIKPWKKNMISQALGGKAPRLADKCYWQNTQTPIQIYSQPWLFWKKIELRCGAAIGRFIRRN